MQETNENINPGTGTISKWIHLLRIQQWIKNLLIFAGIIFAKRLFILDDLITVVLSFILFSFTSSSIYILNDLIDTEYDKNHPIKKYRPLPSGMVSKKAAIIIMVLLIVLSFTASYFLNWKLTLFMLLYFVINVSYCIWLKNIVILDILSVASGYVIRAVVGAAVIGVEISSWLLVCTALLALFLVLGKRRQELANADRETLARPILTSYSLNFLDQMINAVAASVITAYFLYSFSESTVRKMGTKNLGFSAIFVLYGVFRYLYLLHKKGLGESPEKIILTDIPFLINLVLWIGVVLLIVYRIV